MTDWDDDFTGNDDDPLDSEKWDISGSPDIQDNMAELTSPEWISSTLTFDSDFDIQLDYLAYPTGENGWFGWLKAEIDATHWARIGCAFYYWTAYHPTGWQSGESTGGIGHGRINNYGKLRISRSGENVQLYYKDGSAEFVAAGDPVAIGSGEATINISLDTWGSAITFRWDNYLVNSGAPLEEQGVSPFVLLL